MNPEHEIKQLIGQSEMISGSDADARILGDALDHLRKRRLDRIKGPHAGVWRKIMNSKAGKLAIAATIVLAVVLGFQFLGDSLGTSVTFAQVIEPILKAQTVSMDIIVGADDPNTPVIHDMIRGARIRRTVSITPNDVSIIDLETSRVLSLSQEDKKAVIMSLEGLPPLPNYLDNLKALIRMLDESGAFEIEDLGRSEIGGRTVVGFLAIHPKAEVTIWADVETGLPVEIEQAEGQLVILAKNLQFDVQMDESLFSMEIPEGYSSQETTLDLMGSTEEDFIAGLRLRAEVFGDGQFPDDVSLEAYIKQAGAIAEQIKSMELPDEEETELGMKMSRHLLFLRFFKGQGQWTWRGQGVQLGDAKTPIFWYQPQDSETYRVIYGDLHVEDVAAENLPQ